MTTGGGGREWAVGCYTLSSMGYGRYLWFPWVRVLIGWNLEWGVNRVNISQVFVVPFWIQFQGCLWGHSPRSSMGVTSSLSNSFSSDVGDSLAYCSETGLILTLWGHKGNWDHFSVFTHYNSSPLILSCFNLLYTPRQLKLFQEPRKSFRESWDAEQRWWCGVLTGTPTLLLTLVPVDSTHLSSPTLEKPFSSPSKPSQSPNSAHQTRNHTQQVFRELPTGSG